MRGHEQYMQRCLDIAMQATGRTHPNPVVGSVIVYQGKIIGEGFHKQAGTPHAEVHAIRSVSNPSLLKESTLYVTLEPCAHHGKTPPCADLIIHHQIPNVIVGTVDPNPQVAGKGLERLKQAGINVTSGVCEMDCRKVNKRFFTFHEKKRPYILLKWAQSTDGFIDILRDEDTPREPFWISNPISKTWVHKWRAEEHAILVGPQTIIHDNPGLDVREYPGRSPIRLVIDRYLRAPLTSKIYSGKHETWVFTIKEEKPSASVRYIQITNENRFIEEVLAYAYQQGIQSILVEGGKEIHESFIEKGLWDEARVIHGKIEFGEGLPAPVIQQRFTETIYSLTDKIRIYHNNS